MKGRFFKQENVYSGIWCLYYMQGTLYPEGSVISQSLLAVFLAMSIYYYYVVFRMKNVHRVIKALQYLAFMFGVYGLLRLTENTHEWKRVCDATTYFKEYELSILPIFSYYYFARCGKINRRWFFRVSLLFLLTAVVSFYYQQAKAMFEYGADELTNNAGYFVVSLLPVVVFLKKRPLFQYAVLSVIFFLVISGMKRGAIVVVVIASSFFVLESYHYAKGSKKLLYLLLGTLIVVGGFLFFQFQLETSNYMQLRLEKTMEGDMSNRENMYPDYLNYYFKNASIVEYLLGYGADSTLENMGDYAHQDWIETLMNQGFIGICFYLNYWLAILYATLKSFQRRYSNITLILCLFVMIYFMKSMVSMSINGMTIFSTSALAYALAAMDNVCIRRDLNEK